MRNEARHSRGTALEYFSTEFRRGKEWVMAKILTPEGKLSLETKITLGVSALVLAACSYLGLRELTGSSDSPDGTPDGNQPRSSEAVPAVDVTPEPPLITTFIVTETGTAEPALTEVPPLPQAPSVDELSDLSLKNPESLDWGRELGNDEQVYENISQAAYAGLSAQYPEIGFDVHVNVSTAGYQIWAVGTDGRVYGEKEVLLGPDGKVLRDETGNILYGNLRELPVLALLNPRQIEALGLSGYQDVQWEAFPPVAVPEGIDPSEIELVYVTENGIARLVYRARGVVYAAYNPVSQGWVYAEKSGIAAGGAVEGADLFGSPTPPPLEFTPTPTQTETVNTLRPDFSLDLAGVVNKEGVSLNIPFTIGLMKDIRERSLEPIKSFYVNPERPDAPDKLAYYYLRMSWLNHKKNYPEHADISWENYLGEVQAGRGLIKLALADPSTSSWDSPKKTIMSAKEISPLDGMTLIEADSLFGMKKLAGLYAVEDNGRLIIVAHGLFPESFTEPPGKIQRSADFIAGGILPDIYLILGVDINQALEYGYVGNTLNSLDLDFFNEYLKFMPDFYNYSNGSLSRPYFIIEQ